MGTHPIFESDFDCLTDMLRRVCFRLARTASDKSHLAGVTPKLHEEPVIPVDARRHMCDGRHGDIPKEQGHPRVWINLDDGQIHACMYCGLRYQKKAAYDAAAALLAAAEKEEEEKLDLDDI